MSGRIRNLRLRQDGQEEDFEEMLAFQMKAARLPSFGTQYAWPKIEKAEERPFPQTPTGRVRGWTADFFIPPNLLIEIDGKVWWKGGHTSGTGYTEDRIRDAEAMCCGYRVLRVTTGQVKSGEALGWVLRLVRKGQE